MKDNKNPEIQGKSFPDVMCDSLLIVRNSLLWGEIQFLQYFSQLLLIDLVDICLKIGYQCQQHVQIRFDQQYYTDVLQQTLFRHPVPDNYCLFLILFLK